MIATVVVIRPRQSRHYEERKRHKLAIGDASLE
jgi:hypothetical protein